MKECKSTPPARELVAVAEPHEYDRLVLATSMIARHPDYPGKQEVVSLCRQEIDERCRSGILSRDQRSRLLDILGQRPHDGRWSREAPLD